MHAQGQTPGFAIASFVLGLISVVGCFLYGLPSLVCGPLAVIFGHIQRHRARRDGNPAGVVFATWGLSLGYVGLGLVLLIIAFFLAIVIGTA